MSLLRCASVLALALAACAPGTIDVNSDIPTTRIFHGGPIITDGGAGQLTEAVLVRGTQIQAIGPLAQMQGAAPQAKMIDLSGRTLMSGFIDSHVHVRELGMDAIKADLVGVENVGDMVSALRSKFPTPEAGKWLVGQGWDEGVFASNGYPDRAALDAAFPNNPVALESLHGFAGFYNAAALAKAGITNTTPNPEGGTILRREDGAATGVMLALGQGLINQHIPKPDQAQLEAAILAGLNIMASEGVTSVHEAGMTPADVAAFQALAARGELPIRVYGLLDGNDAAQMEKWFARGILDDPEDWLDIRGIKVFYDGSLGSRTALMDAPYSDRPDLANPTARISLEAIDSLAAQAVDRGFQMAVHAIGDAGNDRTMTRYEQHLSRAPDYDHRWRIEHAQVVLPDFYTRMAAQNVLASVQSSHAVGDSKWAEDRVGPDRIRHAYAWQKIRAAGGQLMLNSDLPGEPWTPMQTLYFAVNRKALDAADDAPGWYMEEALTVQQALKAMSAGNAYGAFQDGKLGKIAPGYWADFSILSRNPLTEAPHAIKDIDVLETWVAGEKLSMPKNFP